MTDRVTVYADALPLETDILRTGRFAMIGDGKLAEAILGTSTVVSGFSLTPTAPASLSAVLSPGQVYQQANLEASPWSSLQADTHPLVKQGVLLDAVNLTFVPPSTVGYAQCFLVEVKYADADTDPVLFPYYNAANPDVQYNGPDGSGDEQSSSRRGVVAYQIKAGVAATAGTQQPPTPDAGWAGLYVVTLAQGATSVTAGNIALYAGAPFIPVPLPQVPAAVQAGQWLYAPDAGVAGAMVAALAPTPTVLPDGMEIHVRALNAAAGADTINVSGLGTLPIARLGGGGAPAANDWAAGDILTLRKIGSVWQLGGLVRSDVVALIAMTAPVQAKANVTLYVRTDGNDSTGDGSANTAAKAFATPAAALAYAASRFYFASYQCIVQLGIPGIYAAPGVIQGLPNWQLLGVPAALGNYILAGAPSGALVNGVGGRGYVSGVTIQTVDTAHGWVNATFGGQISLDNINFTTTSGGMSAQAVIAAQQSGSIILGLNINFGGISAGAAMAASNNSTITQNNNMTTTGACVFSVGFVNVAQSSVWQAAPSTITTVSNGSVSGPRYNVDYNSTINTNGGGANYFPGTTVGTVGTHGGYYA